MRRLVTASAVALATAWVLAAGPGAALENRTGGAGEPVRLSARLLGEPVTIEVAGLSAAAAESAARDAFARGEELAEQLAAAVERLNAGAEEERAAAVEPAVAGVLARALQFCAWSRSAHGPLSAGPGACGRLALDRSAGTARIAAGSRVDLSGFAQGAVVDRVVESLRAAGAANGRVRVGRLERAFGPGPEGRGWPVTLPVFEGYDRPLDELHLRDRSLALVWRADWPPGEPRHLDRRTGRPPDGVWATVAVTELAVDAQALAVAALVLGAREGRFRSATLEPEPSILWLLGRGTGRPLLMELNWSALREP